MLSPDTVSFLQDLAVNNNREWFKANEQRYKDHFKFSGAAFADVFAAELGEAVGADLSHKIFRIFRDVRFSKDKTPYNTYLRVIAKLPDAAPDHPMWMMGLDQERLIVGIGTFAFSKENLITYRERIDGPDGDELAALITEQVAAGARLGEPDLKRVPPAYDADHRHGDLLRYKGVTIWFDHDDHSAALGDAGPKNVAESLQRFRPIYDWFAEFTA